MLNFLNNLFYYLAILAIVGGAFIYFFGRFIPMVPSSVGLILIVGGVYFVGSHQGYENRVAEEQIEINRLNAEARQKEQDLKDKLENANNVLRKAQNDIKTKQSNINKRVDSGELRFPSSCNVQANSSSANGNTANGSDIERQAIKDIVALAAEGDTAITNLNACIAQYNQVRDVVNKGVQ